MNVLLSEATQEQFYEELTNRYPDHVFGGVASCQKDEGFEFHQSGSYLMRRGLQAICEEHLSHEARGHYDDHYSNESEEY